MHSSFLCANLLIPMRIMSFFSSCSINLSSFTLCVLLLLHSLLPPLTFSISDCNSKGTDPVISPLLEQFLQTSSSYISTLSFSASFLLNVFCISMQDSLIANYCLLCHLAVSIFHCVYFVYKFPSYYEVHLMSQVRFDSP